MCSDGVEYRDMLVERGRQSLNLLDILENPITDDVLKRFQQIKKDLIMGATRDSEMKTNIGFGVPFNLLLMRTHLGKRFLYCSHFLSACPLCCKPG